MADHKKLAAWFLGPKAENEDEFLALIAQALHGHAEWRRSYYPTDPLYVKPGTKNSKAYKDEMALIREEVNNLNLRMRNSLPTFSSRYKGHMNWEVSMLGLLGYFTAMLYNQNNVATEASAVSTAIEAEVGNDLCRMLQFRSHHEGFDHTKFPTAWGHITSCGSVANFEGAWAARNVKYLAYNVRQALDEPQYEAARGITVRQANGTVSNLYNLRLKEDEWILLNIPANDSLSLLYAFGEKLKGIDVALKAIRQYSPQTKGVAAMPGEKAAYLVPATAHYSWAKSGALLGIGEDRMLRISVDQRGRLDINVLRQKLLEFAEKHIPVLFSVAILGSTTEGAMDPIKKVSELRDQLRAEKNFDFNIHADAAWGGYCCSMLDPPVPKRADPHSAPTSIAHGLDYVPVTELSKHVREQLQAIHLADSITLDPHKAGYIQYPAGSICYQNKRMRDMLAYKAPYITPSLGNMEDPSVGTYGIDGSRAGAAAVATYLHHRITGLNPTGHGMLVGQANFTAKQFWALLATMAHESDPFIISQIHQPTAAQIPLLKKALSLSNDELVYNVELVQLLQENGPDFLINNFAVNYAWPILTFEGGPARTWNTDLQKARDLMAAVGEQLNTPYAQYDIDTTRPKGVSRKGLFVIRDTLFTETYSTAIAELTKNIKVNYDPKVNHEFSMLVSTNMEPWSTAKGFLGVFESELRQAILKGIAMLHDTDAHHSFVIVDAVGAEVFGNFVSNFQDSNSTYQTIVKFELGAGEAGSITGNESAKYNLFSKYRAANSTEPLIIRTVEPDTLDGLLYRDDFWFKVEASVGESPLGTYWLRVSDIILHRHFDPSAQYPANERYIVFGAGDRVYASHIITKYPNYQQLIDLQGLPGGISDLLFELGVEVIVAGVAVEDKTQNPLKTGYTYPIELIREANETFASSFTIEKTVWFSTKLNAKLQQPQQQPHQQQQQQQQQQQAKGRGGSTGGGSAESGGGGRGAVRGSVGLRGSGAASIGGVAVGLSGALDLGSGGVNVRAGIRF